MKAKETISDQEAWNWFMRQPLDFRNKMNAAVNMKTFRNPQLMRSEVQMKIIRRTMQKTRPTP